MRLWCRARRVQQLVVVLLVVGGIQSVVGGTVLRVPPVVGVDGISTWSTFLPVVLGVALADSVASRTQGVEQRVARHVVALDLVLLLFAASAAAALLCAFRGSHPEAAGTVGHVLIATGTATAATLRWGRGAGVLLPISTAVVCLGYGYDAPAGPYVRVLAPDSDAAWDLAVGCAVFGAASIMILTRSVTISFRRADALAR
ncbi:hypothetical protein [Nocardioides stalactiti]|uniref:hypothetical protein n=1 Tax=Nocardioides stalactiti TaxID=2755356 RepID=UPI001602ABDF|nr:hypothetical protein [Nocardioides stalactiti]